MSEAATPGGEPVQVEDLASMLDVEEDKAPAEAEVEEAPEAEAEGEPAAEADEDEQSEEEPDDEEADGEPEETPLHTVKIDGKEQKVTLDELRNGYQRQSDYSRNMNELGNQRRALEQAAAQVRDREERYVQVLNLLEQRLFAETGNEPDWAKLEAEDPVEFSVQWTKWSQAKERRNADIVKLREERDAVMAHRQAEAAQQFQAFVAWQQDKLLETIPEWRDSTKRDSEMGKISAYLQEMGYSDQELSQAYDHRAYAVARDAIRYREMLQKSGEVKKKAAEAPKTAKPGQGKAFRQQSRQERNERAVKRYETSGDLTHLASLLDK